MQKWDMVSEEKKRIAKGLFIQQILNDLHSSIKHNKRSVEKIGASYGITAKTEIKEFTELAIVNKCRTIALSSESTEEKYWKIVDLYSQQVNLSHRTTRVSYFSNTVHQLPFHFWLEHLSMPMRTFLFLNLPQGMVC